MRKNVNLITQHFKLGLMTQSKFKQLLNNYLHTYLMQVIELYARTKTATLLMLKIHY